VKVAGRWRCVYRAVDQCSVRSSTCSSPRSAGLRRSVGLSGSWGSGELWNAGTNGQDPAVLTAHDRDGCPCLPTRSRPTSPPSPPCERPVAAATRWPAAWAWRPPRSWPGRGSFGLEDGPAQLARWFATVTPAPSCRSECSLPGDPVPARIGCLRTRATRRRPTAPGCVSMTSPPRFPNATTRSPTAARSPAVPSTSDPSKGTLQGTQRRRTLLQ